MHIDGARAAVVVVAPYLLQQLRAGEHAPGMLHQVFEQFEFLVRQIDRMPVQAGRIAIGVNHQIAGADETVLVLNADLIGTRRRADRIVAALRHQSQPSLDLGRRGGGHHHVGDAPLRIDDGESAFGQNQHDRRGKPGGVDQTAQRFRRGQIIARIEEKYGVFRHFHETRRIHRQHAHTVGKQSQGRKDGCRVICERHKRQIRHGGSPCSRYRCCDCTLAVFYRRFIRFYLNDVDTFGYIYWYRIRYDHIMKRG